MNRRSQRHAVCLHLSTPAGRGRIALAIRVRGSFRESGGNRLKNSRSVLQHAVVPKSENSVLVVSEPLVANGVATAFCVLTAVHLHDQAAIPAYKIHSKWPDRLLSDKFVSARSSRSQVIPERRFCIRRGTPQIPCMSRPEFISTSHEETPPHPSCSARRPIPASGAGLPQPAAA
jgi:hypothetical protein